MVSLFESSFSSYPLQQLCPLQIGLSQVSLLHTERSLFKSLYDILTISEFEGILGSTSFELNI